jgi:antidote-toxin recognition MazE-like antitoxin
MRKRKRKLEKRKLEKKSSRDKVRTHRRRMRRQGLRLIQIWVPDSRGRAFTAAAHRQSLAVANSPQEAEDQSFIDAISEE